MQTLSVPLSTRLDRFINRMVRHGYASTKADVIRRALARLAEEEEAVAAVLRAEQEIKEGRILKTLS